MKLKIHQIFYDEDSRYMLDRGFIPYDNTGKFTDFYENSVIQDIKNIHDYGPDDYVGVFSWRFREKTFLESTNIHMSTNLFKADAYVFSPEEFDVFDSPYSTKNGFKAVKDMAEHIDKAGIFNFQLKNYSGWVPAWCNYWMAKGSLYDLYVDKYLNPAINFIKSCDDPIFKTYLEPSIMYRGKAIKPHPMFCEGLFGVFLNEEKINYKKVNKTVLIMEDGRAY